MAKMNIFGKGWTNIVFEGRNKKYGAYKLREESPRTTMMALLLGIVCIGLAFGGSSLFNSVFGAKVDKDANDSGVEIIDIELPELPEPIEEIPVEEEIVPPEPEPEQADASKSVQEEKKFTEMEVKEDDKVKKEDITSQKEFDDDIQSGRVNREADNDGEFKTEGQQTGGAEVGSQGDGKGDVHSDENKIHTFVSQKAEPNEGMQKFYNNFMRKFNTPDIGGNVSEIQVRISFVVEKDGSITDVAVVGADPHGAGKEAVRVMKSMPKWKPAQHNGKTVRSRFTLPLKVRIN